MAELSADERRIRYRRALAAIEDAGFVFDEHTQSHFNQWLNTNPEQTEERERIWRSAHTAMRIKADLIRTINGYTDDEVIRERRNAKRD